MSHGCWRSPCFHWRMFVPVINWVNVWMSISDLCKHRLWRYLHFVALFRSRQLMESETFRFQMERNLEIYWLCQNSGHLNWTSLMSEEITSSQWRSPFQRDWGAFGLSTVPHLFGRFRLVLGTSNFKLLLFCCHGSILIPPLQSEWQWVRARVGGGSGKIAENERTWRIS